jgi:hypothetical protein
MISRQLKNYVNVAQPTDIPTSKHWTGTWDRPLSNKFYTDPEQAMANQGDKPNIIYGAIASSRVRGLRGDDSSIQVNHGTPVHIRGISGISREGFPMTYINRFGDIGKTSISPKEAQANVAATKPPRTKQVKPKPATPVDNTTVRFAPKRIGK